MSIWQSKRKNVLINKGLQLKYGIYIAIAMVGIMFLTMFSTYLDIVFLLNKFLPEAERLYVLFSDLITPLLFVKIFFITIVIILWVIVLSHRLAGPIYRFNNVFQKIGRGELDIGEVKLRPKDELKDEAGDLTAMIDNLRNNISNIKEDVNALSSEPGLSPEIKGKITGLKEKLSFFKT